MTTVVEWLETGVTVAFCVCTHIRVFVCVCAGLSLVVGLVLYISSINDEVMNRPREPEQFFHYHYGWSFAFAASSFLLKEVHTPMYPHTHTHSSFVHLGIRLIAV